MYLYLSRFETILNSAVDWTSSTYLLPPTSLQVNSSAYAVFVLTRLAIKCEI
jgi:hypothetical protein